MAMGGHLLPRWKNDAVYDQLIQSLMPTTLQNQPSPTTGGLDGVFGVGFAPCTVGRRPHP